MNAKKRGNSSEITRLLLILKSLEINYILYSKGEYSDANKENLVYLFFQQKKISVVKETSNLYIRFQCFLTLEVCVTSLKNDNLVF